MRWIGPCPRFFDNTPESVRTHFTIAHVMAAIAMMALACAALKLFPAASLLLCMAMAPAAGPIWLVSRKQRSCPRKSPSQMRIYILTVYVVSIALFLLGVGWMNYVMELASP
jgi:hypothetical protein